jgi:hypothetical protein
MMLYYMTLSIFHETILIDNMNYLFYIYSELIKLFCLMRIYYPQNASFALEILKYSFQNSVLDSISTSARFVGIRGVTSLGPAGAQPHQCGLEPRHVRKNFFRGGGMDDFGRTSVIEKTLFQTCGNYSLCTPSGILISGGGIDPPNPPSADVPT